MCVGLHVKFILHYQLAQRPDQAPAACLPKITCELVFIGTPAGCCHSVHLPASWEDCHWLTATVLDGQYHPSQTQQQSEPGTAHHHHHHPTLMPSCPWRKRQKRGSGSTHPLQKMPGLSQGGATTGEFKCVSQNQQYEIDQIYNSINERFRRKKRINMFQCMLRYSEMFQKMKHDFFVHWQK